MKWTAADGSKEMAFNVFDFPAGGVALSMYNTDASIADFAHCSFKSPPTPFRLRA